MPVVNEVELVGVVDVGEAFVRPTKRAVENVVVVEKHGVHGE